jgi:hypothetical protein
MVRLLLLGARRNGATSAKPSCCATACAANRVSTPPRSTHAATLALVDEIADITWWVTKTELDALILENELIKRYKPRYNIRLKDDKTYPYIKVTWQEDFPRVLVVRRMLKDGNRYFGPYTSSRACYETLDALRRVFPYLDCDREITGKDARPCLYFHIKLCGGPCIGAQTPRGVSPDGAPVDAVSRRRDRAGAAPARSADGARRRQPPVRAGRALSRPAAVGAAHRRAAEDHAAPARKTPTTWPLPRTARSGDTAVQVFMVRTRPA